MRIMRTFYTVLFLAKSETKIEKICAHDRPVNNSEITLISNAHVRMSFHRKDRKVYKLLLLSSYFQYNVIAV